MLESSRKQLLSVKFWKILFSDDVNENMMMLTTFSKSAFPMPENNTFETSDFADPCFCF